MFSLKVPAALHHTKIISTTASADDANANADATVATAVPGILNFQRGFYKSLLIISLYCCCWYTLIVAAPQAVAFPTDSLMMFQPQVNASTGMALSHVQAAYLGSEEEQTMLTPGQQVINAVPDNERGDFIMYELAIALQQVEEMDVTLSRYLRNLEDIVEHYGRKLTNLKNVPIYGKFPADLLHWLESEFNLNHRSVYNQLRSRSPVMCNAEGVCYSSDKIGCLCCPF
ncbi:hypothetical protein DOY81_000717 [Sarcophaga bullata]|nr:hypothetical protein DOY81_000717 [Sarcophaga bullata]